MAMVPIRRRVPYPDGTPLLDHPAALRQLAEREGLVLLRGVVDPERQRTLRFMLLERCRAAGWLDPDAPLAAGLAGGLLPQEGSDGAWRDFYRSAQQLREVHSLPHSPRLVAAIAAILGDEVLVHPRHIVRAIGPDSARFTTPPHQDHWYIHGTPDTWTAWMPLSDCPEALGGLALQPRSHRLGVLPMVAADGAGGNQVALDHADEWCWEPLEAGDVIVFHSLTVHQGIDNRTRRVRLSLDLRYQRTGNPVDASSLQPHYGIMPWDELYRDWEAGDPLRRYWERAACAAR